MRIKILDNLRVTGIKISKSFEFFRLKGDKPIKLRHHGNWAS